MHVRVPARLGLVVMMIAVVTVMVTAASVGIAVVAAVLVRVLVGARILPEHLEARGGQAGPKDTRHPELVPDAQAPERALEGVERQARVEQGAQHHVAGGTREAVEVQHARHQRLPASLNDQ